MIRSLKKYLDRVLAFIVSLNMIVLVMVVLWQISSRFIISHPSTFTDELACYQMVCIALLGGAYTVGQKRHLSIDLLTEHLTGSRLLRVQLLYHFTVATFAFLVMILGGFWLSSLAMNTGQISPAMGIAVGYLYLVLPIAGLFILLYSLLFTVELFTVEPLSSEQGDIC